MMPLSLGDLQHEFKKIIFNHELNSKINNTINLPGFYNLNQINNIEYLEIYANNIYIKLIKILKNIYPVIAKLVGEEFFTATAHAYILDYPPLTDYSIHFGSRFPCFLEKFKPAQHLAYLPDTARLDWAYYEVLYEKSESNIDFNKLVFILAKMAHSKNAHQTYTQLKFSLKPAARLISSAFPIFEIRKLCLKKELKNTEKIYLHKNNPQKIFISRTPSLNVIFEKLSEAEFAFLSAFQKKIVF